MKNGFFRNKQLNRSEYFLNGKMCGWILYNESDSFTEEECLKNNREFLPIHFYFKTVNKKEKKFEKSIAATLS